MSFPCTADLKEFTMKRRVRLSVEQLEARNMPSGVSATSALLPPGVIRGFNPQPDPPGVPPAAQVSRLGTAASAVFVPPGVVNGGWSPDGMPTVQVGRAGSTGFQLPGVTRFIAESNE
jgi:hypothetical protein